MSEVTAAPGWYPAPNGEMRWWDGAHWIDQPPAVATPRNGFAIAALVIGIWSLVMVMVPFFIGLFFGGIPSLIAIGFGIAGIVRSRKLGGLGSGMAITGLCLGGAAFLAMFFGAGTFW